MIKAYKCDICGKLYEVSLPYPDLRLYRGQYPHIDQLDLCDECQEKLERFVNGNKEVADAQEMKHGKWIENTHSFSCALFPYKCSVCDGLEDNRRCLYCSHCGAKMDKKGGENNESVDCN